MSIFTDEIEASLRAIRWLLVQAELFVVLTAKMPCKSTCFTSRYGGQV